MHHAGRPRRRPYGAPGIAINFLRSTDPAAEIFPMLPDDELDDLAADIKANGLLHPLAVKDGVLVDGRNRREACRRAGVEPQVEELNGIDPATYILSANIARRNLSKGQRAMAVAKLFPDPEKGGRGKKNSVFNTGFLSAVSVSHARTVLNLLPAAADQVLVGAKSLNEAYREAHQAGVRDVHGVAGVP
jgi:ParB-like nuclease domain